MMFLPAAVNTEAPTIRCNDRLAFGCIVRPGTDNGGFEIIRR
jgi:hypothetical protein